MISHSDTISLKRFCQERIVSALQSFLAVLELKEGTEPEILLGRWEDLVSACREVNAVYQALGIE